MNKIIDEETKRREICTRLYDKARGIHWDLTQEEFSIDENFNFTHAAWRGTYAKGGDNVVTTVEIINMYINECKKPFGKRDLSFIHLVED